VNGRSDRARQADETARAFFERQDRLRAERLRLLASRLTPSSGDEEVSA
jgi:hypothetical protein